MGIFLNVDLNKLNLKNVIFFLFTFRKIVRMEIVNRFHDHKVHQLRQNTKREQKKQSNNLIIFFLSNLYLILIVIHT